MRGPGGPSRASSGVPIRTPGAVTAGRRTVLPSQECRRVPGPKTVECHAAGFALTWRGRPPGRVRSKPINTARGTPWVWRTCGTLCRSLEPERKARHTGLRQASMSRGVEARGSNWTPGVPRALGSSSGRCGSSPRRRRTRRRKRNRAMALLARTGQAIARRRRA